MKCSVICPLSHSLSFFHNAMSAQLCHSIARRVPSAAATCNLRYPMSSWTQGGFSFEEFTPPEDGQFFSSTANVPCSLNKRQGLTGLTVSSSKVAMAEVSGPYFPDSLADLPHNQHHQSQRHQQSYTAVTIPSTRPAPPVTVTGCQTCGEPSGSCGPCRVGKGPSSYTKKGKGEELYVYFE